MKIQLPSSVLLVIDIQSRLMPAIANEKEVVGNATKLLMASRLLDVPTLVTEQNPNGLGSTVPELVRISEEPDSVFAKSRTAVSVTPGQSGPVDRCTAVIHPG